MIRFKNLFFPSLVVGALYLLSLNACVHEPVLPEPVDSMPIDSMPIDTMPVDTMPIDTMPIDTMPQDTGTAAVSCAPDTVYYVQDIAPLLVRNDCKACHTAANNLGNVVLTTYEDLINSNIIDLDDPEKSLLLEVVLEDDPDKIMPPAPDPPMSAFEIEVIQRWIEQGALNNSCEQTDCDVTNVDYPGTVLPILQSNSCIVCHSNGSNPGGGVVLNTEAGLLETVRDGSLFGAIAHLNGYSPMPKGGDRLSDCDITLIKTWMYQVVKL